MVEYKEVQLGIYSNGIHRFTKKLCYFCKQDFYSRNDRKNNIFCSRKCFQLNTETNNTFDLSTHQLEVINGCLLSDGCITKTIRAKNYYFTHSSIHESYSNLLIQELRIPLHKNVKPAGIQTIIGRKYKCSESFEIRSPNSPTFTKMRSKWYDENKIIPSDIEITPTCLLHWYLGDGSINGNIGLKLCTQGFTIKDNNYLIQKLNKLDFCAKLGYDNQIFVPNKRVYEFLNFIGPPPLDCFAYKWDSIVKEGYKGRKCKECEKKFDTTTNSRYFCSHTCYMRNWRKNGPTLRVNSSERN